MTTAGLIEYHEKQAELNKGKEIAARNRRLFHEATVKMLSGCKG